MVFYGIGSIVVRYLIVRSGYIPKILGALVVLGGLGFVAMNVALVMKPAYASDLLLLLTPIAMLLLAAWFLNAAIARALAD